MILICISLKVHKELELDNQIGNSTNLSAKTNFDKSKVELEKDLFVITSGPVPPNPSELVLSNQVKKLFTYAQKIMTTFLLTPHLLDTLQMRLYYHL